MADKKEPFDLGKALDRGVMMMKDGTTTIEVYMYIDTPGVYFSPIGTPIPDEIAASAGYDVEKLAKKKDKQEKLAAFQAELDAEFGNADGEAQRIVLEDRGGYKLLEVGTLGNVIIVDDDDHPLLQMPIAKEAGQKLFEKLAGPVKGKAKVKSLDDDDE